MKIQSKYDKQTIRDLKKEFSDLDQKIRNLSKRRDTIANQLAIEQSKAQFFLKSYVITDDLKLNCGYQTTETLTNHLKSKHKNRTTWNRFFYDYPCASKLRTIEGITDDHINILLRYWEENGIILEDDRDQEEKPFLQQSPRRHIRPLGNGIYQQLTKNERLFTMQEILNAFPDQVHMQSLSGIGPKKLNMILEVFENHGIKIPAQKKERNNV